MKKATILPQLVAMMGTGNLIYETEQSFKRNNNRHNKPRYLTKIITSYDIFQEKKKVACENGWLYEFNTQIRFRHISTKKIQIIPEREYIILTKDMIC